MQSWVIEGVGRALLRQEYQSETNPRTAAVFTLIPAASEALAGTLGRIAAVAHRHPAAADRLLETLGAQAFAAGDTAVGADALYTRFGLLEPRGRALELLPALDNFDRGLAATYADVEAFRAGVELIRKNFMMLLENKGVKEIEAKGKVLDVNFHEAITQVDAPGAEPDTIVEEYQTGYTLGDRVIRHAKVIVAR